MVVIHMISRIDARSSQKGRTQLRRTLYVHHIHRGRFRQTQFGTGDTHNKGKPLSIVTMAKHRTVGTIPKGMIRYDAVFYPDIFFQFFSGHSPPSLDQPHTPVQVLDVYRAITDGFFAI